MIINQNYRNFLSDIGFTTFNAVWLCEEGKLIKHKGESSVIRIQFPLKKSYNINDCNIVDKETFFYIKKHRQQISLLKRLRHIIRSSHFPSEGYKEFNNYCEFRRKGLGTAVPVVAGMNISSSFQADSFIITQDFTPLTDLENIILKHPETLQGEKNHMKKRALLREIALYARRMHNCGMNHKDFNATHILLNNMDTNMPQVAVFDLQRVDRNLFNRWRWPIKALAELNFTLLPSVFSEDDRAFLFSSYKGKKYNSVIDRMQYRWICRKTDKIARHCKKRGLAPKLIKTL
ncbi:MAG: lipopolysaccharide kinase InaA family protein [Desulfobacterales bacterium]